MPEDIQKMIVVDYCDTCPYHGTCKPWKALTRQQRVKLTIGVGVGRFILKGCPLPDKSINEDALQIAISTAIGIVNMSDDEHVQEMAAHIADQLISITKVEDL